MKKLQAILVLILVVVLCACGRGDSLTGSEWYYEVGEHGVATVSMLITFPFPNTVSVRESLTVRGRQEDLLRASYAYSMVGSKNLLFGPADNQVIASIDANTLICPLSLQQQERWNAPQLTLKRR